MLFFRRKEYKIIKQNASSKYHNPPGNKDGTYFNEKRASCAALRLIASMTVEAALSVPLFVAGIVAILFVLQIMQLQLHMQKALYNQAMKVSGYSYYLTVADLSYKAEQVLQEEYVKSAVIKEVGKDYLDNSYIVNGSKGIYLNLTGNPEKGWIDVALQYNVKVPFDLLGIGKLKMVSRARCRTWVGKDADTDDKSFEKVYMTAGGSVYHTHKDCTYLVSKIYSCDVGEISEKRNADGSKYYACKLCCAEGNSGLKKVYYTQYGERYHSSAVCSNLHSNIFTIAKSDAEQKYRLCSKCEKRGE